MSRAFVNIVSAAVMALVLGGCSRAEVEAVNLAQEGDQAAKSNPNEAISKYEQATKLDPNSHEIFFKLGKMYEKVEQWEKMSAAMGTAARLSPKHANYWYRKGYALKALAESAKTDPDWNAPKEPLEKCIKADPNFYDCYHDLGTVLMMLDDEQGALENWTKAIQHYPEELTFYGPLAELYVNLGYYDQAGAVLQAGIGYIKPNAEGAVSLYILMAQVHQAKGDNANVVTSLEKAEQIDTEKKHPEIYFNLGSTYATMDESKKQKAISYLKAFHGYACKGGRAAKYKAECEQAVALIAKLGGSVQ